MTSIGIHDAEVHQLLRQLSERGEDMSPVMLDIADILGKSVERNFEAEGRPKWPALKAATIAQREKKGYWPGKMLQRSGITAASWTTRHNRAQAIAGSNYKIAGYQELGTKKIPARPVRTLTARDIGEIKMVLMNYLFRRQ